MEIMSKWKRLAQVLPVSGMMLLSAGWTEQLNAPVSQPEQSQPLVKKFDALAQQSSDFVQLNLDLSAPEDWSFLMSRLQSAGKTEKSSPELFKRLTMMRQRSVSAKSGGMGTFAADPGWCNHFLKWAQAPVTVNGKTTFNPVVEVSCKDGADYVYADLINVDANLAETNTVQVSSASAEQYGGGLKFDTVTAPATVSTSGGRILRMESLMIAASPTLDQTSYIIERAAASNVVPALSLSHPRKLQTNSGRQEILGCQLRGNALDCDYSVAGYSGSNLLPYPSAATGVAAHKANSTTLNTADYWAFGAPYSYSNLYVPVRGTLTAGSTNNFQCSIYSIDRARLQLIAAVTGRTCYNETSFKSSIATGGTSANINVLNNVNRLFNLAGSGTSPDSCAAETIVNEMTRYSVLISGKLLCGGVQYPFYLPYPRPGQGTTNIIFLNSCMAEGTGITLADGRVVPVEQVKQGDKVVTDSKGTLLTVTGISTGNENKDLVRLRDNAGHDVMLTEAHPVITASGKVVAAKNVKVLDQVKTDKGLATLTSIDRVSADKKKVFNLKLGTDQELLAVGKNERTLFAGGLLIGDSSMQEELEAVRPASPVALLERLPKAWHKDYQNSLKAH